MKIDILVYSLCGGGAERVAVNLANGWHEAGHDVRIVLHEPLHTVEYRPLPEIEIVSSAVRNDRISRAPTRLLRLRRMFARRRPDVIVAIQGNMAIEAAVATVGLGLCIVGCEHSTPERAVGGWPWRSLRPWAYRRLAAVAALTAGAAEELRQICPGSTVTVMPNAIRLPLAENPPWIKPADLLPVGIPVLLAAGRMVEAKGFDRLLVRFARLRTRCPDARLVILGDGPLRACLEGQVQELGLSNRVLLPGRAGNMTEWYERAALYVMTSRWEGLPMVMLEAMALGVPVVATDFRYGPKDVITDGVDGCIVSTDDPEAWADVVSSLLRNEDRRASMACRAKDVSVKFGEDKVLLQWQLLFDDLKRSPTEVEGSRGQA